MDSARKSSYENKKFAAALKGVNLDTHKTTDEDAFEEVKKRAEAKMRGIDVEELEFGEIGVAFEEWEDE